MIYKIDSSYPIQPILEFCSKSLGDERPNAINMDPINWENKSNTLLYVLYKEKRFDGPKAGYLIYTENQQIVAGMGWYPSDWDANVFVQSRAYTIPGYLKNVSVRNAPLTNDLTWFMEDATISQGYKAGCVTVEKYNKKIIDTSIKLNDKTRFPLYRKEVLDGVVVREWREPCIRMRQQKYAGLYNIRNTEQHVMYYLYEPDYEKEFLRKINEKTN